jgi:hypothetical protein
MVALAAVAVLPPLLAWAVRGSPPAPPPPIVTLDDRWGDLPALKKQDQWSPLPKTVRTVPIVMTKTVEEVTGPYVALPPEAAEPVRRLQPTRQRVADTRERVRDVCARHHLRKIVTRGGKSWRCGR